jgi:hypothetical protein
MSGHEIFSPDIGKHRTERRATEAQDVIYYASSPGASIWPLVAGACPSITIV